MLNERRLEDVSVDWLRAFLAGSDAVWSECEWWDFKEHPPNSWEQLPRDAATERNKRQLQFLQDVCAMANSGGGDLVYGVSDGGEVKPFTLEQGASDTLQMQLNTLVRRWLEPAPSFGALGFRLLRDESLGAEGAVLVLRVPRSWSGPHRVEYQSDERYWTRHGNMNARMTHDELRRAFGFGAELAERMRDVHTAIAGAERRRATFVLHLFPLNSFADARRLVQGNDAWVVFANVIAGSRAPRPNIDGYRLVTDVAELQVYRDGTVELILRTAPGSRDLLSLVYVLQKWFRLVETAAKVWNDLWNMSDTCVSLASFVNVEDVQIDMGLGSKHINGAGGCDRRVVHMRPIEVIDVQRALERPDDLCDASPEIRGFVMDAYHAFGRDTEIARRQWSEVRKW